MSAGNVMPGTVLVIQPRLCEMRVLSIRQGAGDA
jgi:hypothetical protein